MRGIAHDYTRGGDRCPRLFTALSQIGRLPRYRKTAGRSFTRYLHFGRPLRHANLNITRSRYYLSFSQFRLIVRPVGDDSSVTFSKVVDLFNLVPRQSENSGEIIRSEIMGDMKNRWEEFSFSALFIGAQKVST